MMDQRCNKAILFLIPLFYIASLWQTINAFYCPSVPTGRSTSSRRQYQQILYNSIDNKNDDVIDVTAIEEIDVSKMSEEEKKALVGNLVANDEWNGMAMELSELIKTAVIEDIKSKGREFLGKESYQVGDISKEIDVRVKDGIAQFRNKEEYELGDFILAMDEASKALTEEMTGKPYEVGDLSKEIDKRIKNSVATMIGKEEYEAGDLTKAMSAKIQERVEEFTNKPYEFGDITRKINQQRRDWMVSVLGKEAADNYQFGDLTKKAFTKFTGKENYEFGDVTKKILGDFFKKK